MKTPKFILNNKGKSIYVPAFSGGGLPGLQNNEKHAVTGKSVRFYSQADDPAFFHGAMLTSAGHQSSLTFAKDLNINTDEVLFLGDSGGYQIATGVIDCSTPQKMNDIRAKIFNWLETNCNYALNLDLPLYALNDKNQMSRGYKLNQSDENFAYFEKNQSGSTRYLNVLHGRNKEDLELWYKMASKYQFTGGWAVASASRNVLFLLQSFFFLLQNGEIEKISGNGSLLHFLGFSRIRQMKYVIYLQEKLNERGLDLTLTFDSAVPALQASKGIYILQYSQDGTTMLTIGKEATYKHDQYLPCQCAMCQNTKYSDYFSNPANRLSTGGYARTVYEFVAFHTLCKLLESKVMMERVVGTMDRYLIDWISNTDDKFIFNVIDKAFEQTKPFDYIVSNQSQIMKADMNKDEGLISDISSIFK